MRASIWAQNPQGLIGLAGKIPWRYAGDFRRFKRVTLGGVVVMGRKTWESIGKPLPGRGNLIVSRTYPHQPGTGAVESIEHAIQVCAEDPHYCNCGDIWFIGGAQVYESAMPYVDLIDVTYVPDRVDLNPTNGDSAVFAPTIDETVFAPGDLWKHEDEPTLTRRVYTRRTLAEDPYNLPDNRRLQEAGVLQRRLS